MIGFTGISCILLFLEVTARVSAQAIGNCFVLSTKVSSWYYVTSLCTDDKVSTRTMSINPCDAHSVIFNEEKRSPTYQLDFINDTPISDSRLMAGWYRIDMNGSIIPTVAPGAFRCGTKYPIWLKGQLPTIPEQQVSSTVCVQTLIENCEREWLIDIKYCCQGYLVYDLKQSLVEDSAYCFGSEGNFNPSTEVYPVCVGFNELLVLTCFSGYKDIWNINHQKNGRTDVFEL